MSSIIHGAGAATTTLSTFNSVDSKKLVAPSRTNLLSGSILIDDRSAFSDFELSFYSDGFVGSLSSFSLFDFDAVRSQRYIVAGSDASKKKNFVSGLRVRHSQKLMSNAVAVMSLSPILFFF